MKKYMGILVLGVVVLAIVTGCNLFADENNTDTKQEKKVNYDTVDLDGYGKVNIPKEIEYDICFVIKGDLNEKGYIADWWIIYARDNAIVYMYDVIILESEDKAASLAKTKDAKQDEKLVIMEFDADKAKGVMAMYEDCKTAEALANELEDMTGYARVN